MEDEKQSQVEQPGEKKSKKKKSKKKVDRKLQSLDFDDHFQKDALDAIESSLGKFCHDLSITLLRENKRDRLIKEFREFFVLTWLLLLQIYIFKKDREDNTKQGYDEMTHDFEQT